jgi:hypothetical protein
VVFALPLEVRRDAIVVLFASGGISVVRRLLLVEEDIMQLPSFAAFLARVKRASVTCRPGMDGTSVPLAVLIDGENISADLAVHILAMAGNVGHVSIRRVYGNWSHTALNSWRAVAPHYGFQMIQVAHPVSGKNATDIMLTVDAMELLAQGVRYFCLASSDSDFIPLVRRLREKQCFVLGVGKMQSVDALRTAYHVFVTTDQLLPAPSRGSLPVPPSSEASGELAPFPLPERNARDLNVAPFEGGVETERSLIALFLQGYSQAFAQQGPEWVPLTLFGSILRQMEPTFTPLTYGSKKLKPLVLKYPQLFEIQTAPNGSLLVRLLPSEEKRFRELT